MFLPRVMLLFNFLGQVYCALSTISIFFCLTSFSVVEANKCITKGTYLEIRKANGEAPLDVIMPNSPKYNMLEEVGSKYCGFILYTYNVLGDRCAGYFQIEYGAVDVVGNITEPFCNYYKDHAICVCEFYGCNSVNGVFYESVVKALTTHGEVVGEQYGDAIPWYRRPPDHTTEVSDCLLQYVEKLYSVTSNRKYVGSIKGEVLHVLKISLPQLFPKDEDRAKMIKEGELSATSPMPNVQAVSEASALTSGKISGVKKQQEDSFGVVPLVITVVLFVLVLGLVAAMIIAFICFRRKVNDNLTTIRSVASETSMHGSVYLVPNRSAAADPSVPVAPAQQSGMIAPSTISKSSGRTGTSPSNKSLVAAPNPAPVARK